MLNFLRQLFFLLIIIASGFNSFAQDSLKQKELDEVIIYSGKFAEKKKNLAQRIELITSKKIAGHNTPNTGDLLINTGNVFVQKSQQGGSSPVLRGFEASRVLLVIDGIRMNNAIYRAGHLQNAITVDQNMLERVEILYGPASTIYGSDALGGVIHFRTKIPELSKVQNTITHGSVFGRYSTANNEKTFHADLSVGTPKFGWLQSYNYSDFGDLKMGSKDHPDYPGFGRRKYYIDFINGVDSVMINEDDRVQKFSGYRQWDITQKILFQPNERSNHLLNLQLSNSSDIPRYDRLQDTVPGGRLRYSEWYYGPQLRTLAAWEMNIKKVSFFNEFRTILSYQHIEESRHQRVYRQYTAKDNRYEDLDVFALTADGRSFWNQHELTLGIDAQLNYLISKAHRSNIFSGEKTPLDSRYPNGRNSMNYFGVYAQHIFKSANGKLVLNDGLRVQGISVHSTIADNSFFNFPFTSIRHDHLAFTGNIGIVYMPDKKWRWVTGVSSGFRAPNIDDLSRIFESGSSLQRIVVPNPGIRPEYSFNIDLGLRRTFENFFRIELNGFYTLFTNAISLFPFQLNGADSILYNGTMSRVYSNQNVNKAFIYGLHTDIHVQFNNHLQFNNTLNYTYGRLDPKNGSRVPLDHIPPFFGKTSVQFESNETGLELYSLYNGWKRAASYNPGGEDNAQYATPEGIPAWWTLNLKCQYQLNRVLTIQAGVENILDRNYRFFASGFSAPGRNFIMALRGNF